MNRWVGKVAIVTGASGSIGAAIVEALVQKGLRVVGLDKRVEELLELAEKLKDARGKLYARQVDVRKEEDLESAFDWVRKELGGVDVLVNNAGVVHFSKITQSTTEKFCETLDVNVLAVAICIREAARSMKERGVDGHIISINSIMGHVASGNVKNFGLYPSSKFAVTAMTEVVRKELINAKTKIKITSISPGFVNTKLYENSGLSTEVTAQLLRDNPLLEPVDIAHALVYVLSTPPNVQITELTIRPVGEVLC